MTEQKYKELESEAINMANKLNCGYYWKEILKESVKAYYLGKRIAADKSWK